MDGAESVTMEAVKGGEKDSWGRLLTSTTPLLVGPMRGVVMVDTAKEERPVASMDRAESMGVCKGGLPAPGASGKGGFVG